MYVVGFVARGPAENDAGVLDANDVNVAVLCRVLVETCAIHLLRRGARLLEIVELLNEQRTVGEQRNTTLTWRMLSTPLARHIMAKRRMTTLAGPDGSSGINGTANAPKGEGD